MLNYEFPPIGGGAATANYHLLEEYKKNPDLEIDLVTSSSKDFEIERLSENIKIFKLGIKKKDLHYWRMYEIASWTWKAFRFSKKLINENRYDLCHCWFGWPTGIIGYLFRKRVPYIIALRGSDVPGYNERLKNLDRFVFKFVSRITWNNAKAVSASSNDLKKLAKKTLEGININVIYNGVNIDKFSPRVNKSNHNFEILFVGRLIKRKGLEYLLKALQEVFNEYKNCKLTIVGEGPERKNLQYYCKRMGIESNVKFLREVERKDLAEVYQKASAFVLPSLEESLSNAIQEAMASGLPIITTNTGAAELMDNNGFVVEKGNYIQLKEAILKYIRHPDLLIRHGQQSRKLAEEMTWSHAAKAYIEIYCSI